MPPILKRRWVQLILAAIVTFLLAIGIFLTIFGRGLPSADALLTYEPPLPSNLRGLDGTPIQTFARERRVQLAFDEYPAVVVNAFLSAEDKDFFRHGGIDYLAFLNGVFEYVTKMGSGERARGGSTITQQVAKNLLIGDEYSPTRKIREAILARRIERALDKKQILELYLNQIFLGRNAYGVQSAAQAYFRKDIGQLSLSEAAYLAALPKAPANYTPERDMARALERRAYVLREMEANGYITAAQRAEADRQPLGAVTLGSGQPRPQPPGGYFTEEVRRQLIDRFGETAKDGDYSVYAGGLWVRTSFDPNNQQAAERALRDGLVRYESGRGWSGPLGRIEVGDGWPLRLAQANKGVGYADWRAAVVLSKTRQAAEIGLPGGVTGTLPASAATMPKRGVGGRAFDFLKAGDIIAVKQEGDRWALRSVPKVQGGFIVENPHTGQILAMQGGFDSKGDSFNRATQAERQPGSSFKPFVYAAAFDNGLTPASIIVDGPFCVYQSVKLGRKCFRNFSGGYAGPRTIRWGLEQSRNLMTVRTAATIGMERVVGVAERMGIGRYPATLGVALGAGETTVERLTNAYAMLANNGRELKPTLIDFVQDRKGKVIYRADTRPCDRCNMAEWDGKPMPRPPVVARQLLDAMTAYQVVHVLEGVVQRGTATVLRDLGRPLFGKTGTTTGPTNVWFVGGSADVVAGVYVGYDRPVPLGGAEGGTVAAPIFKQWAQVAMKDMPVVPFRAPAGIRLVRIDRRTGRQVFGGWPTSDPLAGTIWEAFKPATEPRRALHRDEVVPKVTEAVQQGPRDSEFLQREGGIY
nr:transglycosylase domain-containing protein [Sphingomonas quercus]